MITMKTQEAIIRDLRGSMNDEPSVGLKNRIIESAAVQETTVEPARPARRRFGTKAAVAAATVVTLLLATTVFAYGSDIIDAIREFMFGDSTIEQVDEIDVGDALQKAGFSEDAKVVWLLGFEGTDNSVFGSDQAARVSSSVFATVDEANDITTFTIGEPTYLPRGVAQQTYAVEVFTNPQDGEVEGGTAWVSLKYEFDGVQELLVGGIHITSDVDFDELNLVIDLNQYYVGPDGHAFIETVYPIEKVMVGDNEASLVQGDPSVFGRGLDTKLCWKKGDIFFEMTFSSKWYDAETMIEIAESIVP
jgi:hypothetical protein